MPIEVDAELLEMSEARFKEIAYAVTGAAFAVHNEYGTLFGEKVYQAALVAECVARGLRPVQHEVRIRVTHAGFQKDYYIDLLVGGGALFELKAGVALADEHRAQALNYLFLAGLPRAKLFNFGADALQHEFVSTRLTAALRQRLAVVRQRWEPLDRDSLRFGELLLELLGDWGAFLQLSLYHEAVAHFFGGLESVLYDIPVIHDGAPLAMQRAWLLNAQTAFKLTAVAGSLDKTELHLRRWLHHTKLKAVQWVNLHQHDVTFITLLKTP
jgi:GxxExxY protein